jgi:hypothetical protein
MVGFDWDYNADKFKTFVTETIQKYGLSGLK